MVLFKGKKEILDKCKIKITSFLFANFVFALANLIISDINYTLENPFSPSFLAGLCVVAFLNFPFFINFLIYMNNSFKDLLMSLLNGGTILLLFITTYFVGLTHTNVVLMSCLFILIYIFFIILFIQNCYQNIDPFKKG